MPRRLLAHGSRAGRREILPNNCLGLRYAVDRVREARFVAVEKSERRRSHRRPGHLRRIERHGVERRTGAGVQRAGIDLRCGLVGADDQPQRLAVEPEGEPGCEDRVALMREVDPPPRFRARRRCPPHVLVVRRQGEIRLRAPRTSRHR